MKKSAIVGGVIVIGGVLLVAGGLAYWKYAEIKKAGQEQQGFEPSESVTVVAAQSRAWAPTAKLVGAIFAIESVELRNEVAGVLEDIKFESGAIVEKGEVLVEIDASTERADLAAARASVKVMEAGREVAKADVQSMDAAIRLATSEVRRLTQAVESKAAAENMLERAQSDLDQSQAKLKSNRATVDRASAELDQATARVAQLEVLLAKKTLRAPFRARAGIRTIHHGQYLPEGTKIVDLQSVQDTVYLDFAIPQDEAWRVKPGMVVLANSAALGADGATLTVQAIDATVDRSTRNVRVRSVVANKGEKLRPGTYVDVEVPMDLPKQKVIVPTTSVRRASYGDHVFVVVDGADGTKRVKQRLVKLGPSIFDQAAAPVAGEANSGAAALSSGMIIIEEGLAVGEVIAAGGSFKLRDGALITIAGAAGAGASTPAEAGVPAAALPNTAATEKSESPGVADKKATPEKKL